MSPHHNWLGVHTPHLLSFSLYWLCHHNTYKCACMCVRNIFVRQTHNSSYIELYIRYYFSKVVSTAARIRYLVRVWVSLYPTMTTKAFSVMAVVELLVDDRPTTIYFIEEWHRRGYWVPRVVFLVWIIVVVGLLLGVGFSKITKQFCG